MFVNGGEEMEQPETDGMETDRRAFVTTFGKAAIVAPPVITALLSTSLASPAIAKSTGGRGCKPKGGSGHKGYQGKGYKGHGSNGSNGYNGSKGNNGSKGYNGSKGNKGSNGSKGNNGSNHHHHGH
jgi:hypothetical protein